MPFTCKIVNSVEDAIELIRLGRHEILLVPYKSELQCDKEVQNTLDGPKIATDLEKYLLDKLEINQFYDIIYGTSWGLRPIPIFHNKSHTVITKNIGIHIGLSINHRFYFTPNSSRSFESQDLMFKLKPNPKLGPHNHIMFYNRYDGSICSDDTKTDDYVAYDATKYLLVHCPLLTVAHHDMTSAFKHACICVENAEYLNMLNFIHPCKLDQEKTIRQCDLLAAQTSQHGLLTHNGHPNLHFSFDPHPSVIIKDVHCRYAHMEPKSHEGLQHIFKPWPSFLYRRNWFIALGNQREKGVWIGACKHWIAPLDLQLKTFLLQSWVPEKYRDFNIDAKSIDDLALGQHQKKFVLLNLDMLKSKLQESCPTNLDDITNDNYMPCKSLDKLLRRRVIFKETSKVTNECSKKHGSKQNTQVKKKSNDVKTNPFIDDLISQVHKIQISSLDDVPNPDMSALNAFKELVRASIKIKQ